MSRANTLTMLPLDRFAYAIGIHPLHFNQVFLSNGAARLCGEPILQYSWQHADRVGREDIAQAIATAEDLICRHLGYKVLPQWEHEEISAPFGRYNPLRTRWKYVLGGGVRAKVLIDDDVAITYSDNDGDGYEETATVTVTTTVTDPEEVTVFYPEKDGDDAWQIRPTTVTIEAGVATIKFARHQCVKEDFIESLIDPRGVDGEVDSNFLTEVDVYRIYNDPSQQVSIASFGGCCDSGCINCESTTQGSIVSVANSRNGIVHIQPGAWNPATLSYDTVCFGGSPSRVVLDYRAGKGYRTSTVNVAPEWERAIAYFAITLLDRPLCKCQSLQVISGKWSEDLAQSSAGPGGSSRFNVNDSVRNCPLGTTRGALNAWRLIQQEQVGEAS